MVSPIFIACGARSGSTLLRRLLGSHPDIACPAETDFALLVQAYVETARALTTPDQTSDVLYEARDVVNRLAERHLDRWGKKLWCDKSMSNVLHLDMLATGWPDARFILLHRHPMDFIASALIMQPWGLTNYGFTEFATRSPGDSIGALAAYWLDRTSRLLIFEQRHLGRSLRLRYEDLVMQADEELARLWTFLDVAPESGAPTLAFEGGGDMDSTGSRGDNKTWYTDGVHTESIGSGARIPVQSMNPPALRAINDMGGRLGYAPVGPDWGAGGPLPATSAPPGVLEVRVMRGYDTVSADTTSLPAGIAGPAVVTVDHDVVDDLRERRQNPAELTRTRRLRYYGPPIADARSERALIERVAACLMQFRPGALP